MCLGGPEDMYRVLQVCQRRQWVSHILTKTEIDVRSENLVGCEMLWPGTSQVQKSEREGE
jgi:hypothetical protein